MGHDCATTPTPLSPIHRDKSVNAHPHTPFPTQRGCADGSNRWHVMCVYCVESGHTFRGDSSSAPANTIPFRPCFPDPPGGHERHNPLRGRERDVAWTRGSASAAQPRAVWHNALGVGGGDREWTWMGGRGWAWMGVDGRGPICPSGNAQGRAIDVFPPGIPKVVFYPIPLRESQRDSAMKPGLYGATQRCRAERVRGVD